ncbi:MAG: DUF58 domain-containing protein [Planctomycetaceae bacterium]|nr:DUF58 domain-containing protein [Planctomycetaceae bacterium]
MRPPTCCDTESDSVTRPKRRKRPPTTLLPPCSITFRCLDTTVFRRREQPQIAEATAAEDARELLRRVRRIRLRTRQVVNDALAGQYHAAFKGRGMEFEEVRPYQVGDDVRSIDWNVSARLGDPHIKLFREERELTVMIAADLSGSLSFGTVDRFKRELVAEFAATVAFSAAMNNDKIGLLSFTDQVEGFVPPRKGTRHVMRIVRDLLAIRPKGQGTGIGAAVGELDRVLRQRAVVFVVSDFLDQGWERSLLAARRRHDVVPVVVSDQREHEIPAMGLVEFTDPETGQRSLVDTGRRRVRRRFEEATRSATERRDTAFRRMRLDPLLLETGSDFVEPLTTYFRRRERRRSR